MKILCLVPIFCGLATAQTTLDNNSAAANMRNRLLTLNLKAPLSLRLTPHAKQAVCSVPLLKFVPKGEYKMPVLKPASPATELSRDGMVQVPAPPCDR